MERYIVDISIIQTFGISIDAESKEDAEKLAKECCVHGWPKSCTTLNVFGSEQISRDLKIVNSRPIEKDKGE